MVSHKLAHWPNKKECHTEVTQPGYESSWPEVVVSFLTRSFCELQALLS